MEAIGTLGVGEALISTLDEKGVSGMIERTLLAPPRSRVGPLTPDSRFCDDAGAWIIPACSRLGGVRGPA